MAKEERVIREFILRSLNEDFGGDLGGMGFGFGGGYIDPADMYTVFIKPFVDVYDTAQGKTKELSVAGAELVRVSIEAILTSVIPILASDYDDIFNKYESQLSKIKEQYKPIYDSTWTAFTDNDVVLAAFGMFPTAMITQLVVRKAPIPVINTLDALTGGFFEDYFTRLKRYLNPDENKPLDAGGITGGGGGDIYAMGGYGFDGFDGGGFGGFGESIIKERKKKKPSKNIFNKILHPKIMLAAEQNSTTRKMMKETRAAFQQVLNELFERIKSVISINDIEQLQKLVKKPIKGIDKLKQAPEEQRKQISATVMKTVKSAIKNVYIKNLNIHVKQALSLGVPKDHPMINDLNKIISKIKAL